MKRITITIDVPDDAYTPQYVEALPYHVSPARVEILTQPYKQIEDLLRMVEHHAPLGVVEISYPGN